MTELLLFLVVLLFSVSTHELMHALVAYRLGDDLAHSQGRISLNPLRHIDPMLTILLPTIMLLLGLSPILAAKPVPINTSRIKGEEFGLAAVGLAGPFTNLVLAFVFGFPLRFGAYGDFLQSFLEMGVLVNVGLFVFNMLPIPPLDGSRLLYAVAPESVQRIIERIEAFGIFLLIAILFLFAPVITPIIQTLQSWLGYVV